MIKLYTIGCPKCIVLEKKLTNAGIEFEKITDEVQIEEIAKKANVMSLPLLDIDGEVLDFSKAVSWVNSK